jgi:hypothetical protein
MRRWCPWWSGGEPRAGRMHMGKSSDRNGSRVPFSGRNLVTPAAIGPSGCVPCTCRAVWQRRPSKYRGAGMFGRPAMPATLHEFKGGRRRPGSGRTGLPPLPCPLAAGLNAGFAIERAAG